LFLGTIVQVAMWAAGGAEHCRSVLVREGVRAGPSIGGGTMFVRVRCRLRGARDMNSELVLVP
jgi:hypothetical protein